MIEAVFGIVVVVCDFSEGGDFVASIAEISREFFEFGARFGVIGFSAVTRGVKSGERAARLGAQLGEATNACVKRMPRSARRRMLGVRTTVAPYGSESSWPWSSARKMTLLGEEAP